jgi:hypothetical protein
MQYLQPCFHGDLPGLPGSGITGGCSVFYQIFEGGTILSAERTVDFQTGFRYDITRYREKRYEFSETASSA